GRAARALLVHYQDKHLEKPEQLLDAWGLLHFLYWGSPALDRRPGGARLAEGRALADLAPAPAFPEACRGCPDDPFGLLEQAQSRPVRLAVLGVLRKEYARDLTGLSFSRLRRLLLCPHEEVQTFAAELLKSAKGLKDVPLSDWLTLLSLDNPVALTLI